MKDLITSDKTPPKTLSGLIRLGLADLRAVEAQPEKYEVEMGSWHSLTEQGKCAVCFAGAVMANSLGVAFENSVNPSCFTAEWEDAFSALDYLRDGFILAAARYCGITLPENIPKSANIPEYDMDTPGFYAAMEKLAATLEKENL